MILKVVLKLKGRFLKCRIAKTETVCFLVLVLTLKVLSLNK